MGSSHSRNNRDASSSRDNGNINERESTPGTPRRRMNTLRRLSTLGMGMGRRSKRDRAQSTGPSSPSPGEKRQRIDPSPTEREGGVEVDPLALERTRTIESIRSVLGDDWTPPAEAQVEAIQVDEEEDTSHRLASMNSSSVSLSNPNNAQSGELDSSAAGPSNSTRPISPAPRPVSKREIPSGPAPPITYPVRRPATPVSRARRVVRPLRPPIWASSLDVRRRKSFISTRDSTSEAGPGPSAPALRRTRSEPAAGTPLVPTEPEQSLESVVRRHTAEQEYLRGTLALLEERLQTVRREVEESDAEIDRARERLRTAEEATVEGAPTLGPVLMIQGLAQTQPPPVVRRSRIGRRRGTQMASISEQASMIASLLIVASAATATTLLSTERPPPAPTGMIEDLMRRIRPRRPFSVERTLGSYIAESMNTPGSDNQTAPSTSANVASTESPTPTPTPTPLTTNTTPAGFTAWLDSLQWGITDAMREYAEGGPPSLSRSNSEEPPPESVPISATRPTASRRESAPPAPIQPAPTDTLQPPPPEGAIPRFHTQAGQSTTSTRSAITRDEHGVRHLNFFRAHVFDTDTGNDTPAGEGDAGQLVPCVFVGVRSVNHDPAMSTNDLANHPSFPFSNGQVPPSPPSAGATANSATSTLSSTSPAETSPDNEPPSSPNGGTENGRAPPTRAQAFRARLSALSPFSTSTTPNPYTASGRPLRVGPIPSDREPPPASTYLMYVIGGHYPRNHPVLTMPGLLTGGALTDEEMVLVGELMGQVKPPTATAEEVEHSGLKVVDASEIMGMVERNEIISSSAERCLVCLSDFEQGEACRLLTCRHVFHKECVDQWIKVGRNACPACRSEAVDKAKAIKTDTEEAREVEAEV